MMQKHPLTLLQAENQLLLQENSTLRKEFHKLLLESKRPEFEEMAMMLSVLELQRERIHFLRKELTFVQERIFAIQTEDREITAKANSKADTEENLERRLQEARWNKAQLEAELKTVIGSYKKQLNQMKVQTAKQKAELILPY